MTDGPLSQARNKIRIGGLALVALSLAFLTGPAVAQTGTDLLAKNGSGPMSTSLPTTPVNLPDAPLPAALSSSGAAASDSGESTSLWDAQLQSTQPQDKQQAKPGDQNPQTPPATPSLSDLGLTPQQMHSDNKQQELLDKRTEMLKIHQRLGLITLIPVAAACISSVGAPPDHGNYGNTTSRDIHVAIGGVAVGMYAATAFYAIRAPKLSNEPARGGIKLHKYLIYLHAPGMVLTPILGAIAFNQINSGQKVHGIASAHSAVAVVTAASYGAAIIAVSWPIHFKF